MVRGRTPNARRLVLLLWLLVAFFYFYISYDYIQITSNDRQFAQYLQSFVIRAGNERRSAKDIRDFLMIKAEELSLPISREQILVRGGGETLNIIVDYDAEIEIPLLRREVYTKKFQHKVSYQGPR
jgi:hypothetical protein